MKKLALFVSVLALTGSTLAAEENDRMLFTFEKTEAARQWQTVNDGVMGGRSVGRFRMTDDRKLEFSGTLSLANNGGFASVRSKAMQLGLKKGDAIVLLVRGYGRQYNLNLYTKKRFVAFSFRARFETKKDRWIEVVLPVEKFVATRFGRVLKNVPLDPKEVNGIGILLGDKKAGPFKLEVDTISIRPAATGKLDESNAP